MDQHIVAVWTYTVTLTLVEAVGKYCMRSRAQLCKACLEVFLQHHADWHFNIAIFWMRVRQQISVHDSFVLHMPETTVLCDCSNPVTVALVQS